MFARIVKAGLATGTAGITGAVTYRYNTDEGFRRSVYFWKEGLPLYARYRYLDWKTRGLPMEERLAAFELLHDTHTDDVKEIVYNLRGFYLKLAQTVSTRDELVPPQYLVWCKQIQDSVLHELNTEEVRAKVEEMLQAQGESIESVFESFDLEPCGAASIGQVHRGVLKNGKEVVVKIQYPNVEETFRNDVGTIRSFCATFEPQHLPFMDEIERQFLTEFDYRAEARNLELVRDNLIVKGPWKRHVEVPKPFMKYCSREVLMMEYIPGSKLEDGVRSYFTKVAQRQGKTLDELIEEQRSSASSDRKLTVAQASRRFQLLGLVMRVQDFFYNTYAFFRNWTIGLLPRTHILPYREFLQPLDLGHILDVLLKVHAHEIFQDGSFNGDPHPGNILLMPDGRLGLIDYGQVKHMSLDTRIKYAKLIMSLAEDDREKTVDIITNEMGLRTKYMKPDILYKYACFWHDRDTEDVMMGLNIYNFMCYLEEMDPVVEISEDYIMAGRVSILMRGMGNAFNMQIRTAQYWKSFAKDFLESQQIVGY